MTPNGFWPVRKGWSFITTVVLCFLGLQVWADEIEMQNGDHYVGKVVALNGDTLVIQSELLGKVELPREKVAHITLGAPKPARPVLPATPTSGLALARVNPTTNTTSDLPAAFRQLGAHTNLVKQIQSQFLGDAGPEANQQFETLLSGVMSGKITMTDLRAQAQSAADQLRALKKDSGESPGFAADAYLAILDHFLKEGAPSVEVSTNGAASAAKPKRNALPEQD
jgi:hypothetical protein